MLKGKDISGILEVMEPAPLSISPASNPSAQQFEQMGGQAMFERLVSSFYARVATDEVLRPMYPEQDLQGAAQRLSLFLQQYWGGPKTYGQMRGHPRLRLRHHRFPIDEQARDRWLSHMRAALDDVGLHPDHDALLWDYLTRAAHSLVNQPDPAAQRCELP